MALKISSVTVDYVALMASKEAPQILWELERQGMVIQLLITPESSRQLVKMQLRERGILQFFDDFVTEVQEETILLDRPEMITMRYITAALAPRVRTNFWILSKLASRLTLDKTKSLAEDDQDE